MPDLLYEIGTEELPADYIMPALEQLAQSLRRELNTARLQHGTVRTTGTPRRLVVAVADITEHQPDSDEVVMGPPAKVAFSNSGAPAKAAEGFAKSQGVTVSDIFLRDTPRGQYCCIRKRLNGRPTIEILAEVLPHITFDVTFPKSMVWLSSQRSFARPLRALLALFGDAVIPFSLFGVQTGRSTEGHPILSSGRVEIKDADFIDYETALRKRCVMVDIAERKETIRWQVDEALRPFGAIFREERLLDEVTNLVQWPSVITGNFDPEFLSVPAPVIEAAMMEHQRYFPVRNADGNLFPRFLVVSDRKPQCDDLIRDGNEQVLKARLADAKFFDQQDKKLKLADRVDALSAVAFLKDLGSYADKSRRLVHLTQELCAAFKLDPLTTEHATRAALLCKADLLTEMVGEFPALQGKVGHLYAVRDGEPSEVATAIEEHYMPRSADGFMPKTRAGRVLSLAEKLDNLTSCFALGLIPTGSADPYALRRQAQAVLRLIEESGLHVSLKQLITSTLYLLPPPHNSSTDAVLKLTEFMRDRLFQLSLDRGAPHDLINATLAPGFDDVLDFCMRLKDLRQLATEAEWPDLVAAVERTWNISKASSDAKLPDPSLLTEPLEHKLLTLFETNRGEIMDFINASRYMEASRRYAEAFALPLHEFFEKVFVNVEDDRIRRNRLCLLRQINQLYSSRIADLSQITTGIHID